MNLHPKLPCLASLTDDGFLKIDAEAVRSVKLYFPENKLSIIIAIESDKRSLNQNSWYWVAIVPAVFHGLRQAGFDKITDGTQVHELLKLECNYDEIVNHKDGEIRRFPKSTANMTKAEFFNYCERCRKWAAEFLLISIPDPIPQLTEPENGNE